MEYDEGCYLASVDQGLCEIVCRLATYGIPSTIDQEGGFCMVGRVRTAGGDVISFTREGAVAHPEGASDGLVDCPDAYMVIDDARSLVDVVMAIVHYINRGGEQNQ
jgi:hypothetical protein